VRYTFEFEIQEVNTILLGLGELPAKHSHNLINKIQTVVRDTNAAEAEKKPDPPP
jgi:hypothetical protein